jgi:hypothetical protein
VLVAYLHPATHIEHSFHQSLMSLVNYDAAHNQRLFASAGPLMMRCGTGGLVEARNKTMAHFLDQASEDWLWTVDTDMGFAANTVDLLVDSADPVERPVVGALCFGLKLGDPDGYGGYRATPFPTIYGWSQDPSGKMGFRVAADYTRGEVIRVAGTGAACLLIHRTAAEKVRAEHGDSWFDPVRYPDGRFVSEDLSFCYRLGSVGIPIHVDTAVKTTHAKQVWVGEPQFLEHRLLSEAAAAVAGRADG